jgi:hypothetical protein
MAAVRDSVATLATATRRLAAAIDPQDDPDLMQIVEQQGWSPAYDQAGTLAQMTLTQPCKFQLGFGDLYALIPGPVGLCLEDQRSAANGDALQRTTGGLLVWRKADNWTAFTDGYWTWINGPDGLVSRLNTERFPWESQ